MPIFPKLLEGSGTETKILNVPIVKAVGGVILAVAEAKIMEAIPFDFPYKQPILTAIVAGIDFMKFGDYGKFAGATLLGIKLVPFVTGLFGGIGTSKQSDEIEL